MTPTQQKKLAAQAAAILGSMTSEKKKKSSAANGKLGGYWKNFARKGETKSPRQMPRASRNENAPTKGTDRTQI